MTSPAAWPDPAVPSGVNRVVDEWVAKAVGDYRTGARELGVTHRPNYDAVCFHAQIAPRWVWPVEQLRRLTVGAVEFRYPGRGATAQQAAAAMEICRALWAELVKLF